MISKDAIKNHIERILDVNASWVEVFNEIGCLLALDADLSDLSGSICAFTLAEDNNTSTDRAAQCMIEYAVENNYVWDVETLRKNPEFVRRVLDENGFDVEEEMEALGVKF